MRHSAAMSLAAIVACGCTHTVQRPAVMGDPLVMTPAARSPAPEAAPAIPNLVRSTTAWEEGGGPGVRVRTEHYNLHLALKEPAFRGWMPAYMEACHQAYATALGPLPVPEEPLDLYIFASREPWEAWTRRTLGKDAGVYLALGRGGFTTDGVSVLYDIGRVDTLTIAAHEGWHQFSQRSLKHVLPTWMEEGLACWMEGTRLTREGVPTPFRPWRNFERWNELRNAAKEERLIPLGELLATSPQQCLESGKDRLLAYYAECWALVHFLNEGEGGKYRAALRELMQDAAQGRVAAKLLGSRAIANAVQRQQAARTRLGNGVVLAYFNPDFAAFESEYDRFVQGVTRRGAGDRIYRGESPLTEMSPAPAAPAKPPAK